MPTLVDALIDALIALDTKYVFGVSGANIEHLHDAIHRRGRGRLRSILARSEAGAAFMADARARVHRTLGVCCATSGGGMMNLAVGIAEAYAESVPVLAIVGQPPEGIAGLGAFQDSSGFGRTNAVKLFEAISKFTAKITRPDQFWQTLQDAVVAALGERPGPAVLILPRCIQDAEVPPLSPGLIDEIRARIGPSPVESGALRTALAEIRAARNPVLLIGHGARRSSRPRAVVDFARAARIPVATTMSARSEFDNDDSLFLGVLGIAGHPSVAQYVREVADLLIVAGAGLNAMTRSVLSGDGMYPMRKRVVAVNVDPRQIMDVVDQDVARSGMQLNLACLVKGDVGVAFDALLTAWQEAPFVADPLREYERRYFEPRLAAGAADSAGRRAGERTLRPSQALAILQQHLPRAGHLLYDAGNCAAAALHFLDVPPGVSATIALGMGGMGFAIAGAIGAQLGSPDHTRTIVVTGDGAFLMAGFEIHTAVDLGLPILFVVFNNNSHGMCVTRQHVLFGGREECVRYTPVDIISVVRGLGDPAALWVGRARSAGELYTALEEYRSALPRPGVLELCLAEDELPPFLPLLPKDAPTTTLASIVANRAGSVAD